ncbi:MAG: class I tRNA ligase family protein [Clostridiales bacterium]|nr:class I tRNA ligase family protein [Clostridiales bacterium]
MHEHSSGVSGRPVFPQRAVVTAGMPYGNKSLHMGHVGGCIAHADIFARFLRDRIGPGNVLFVSGTDCYGSPIMEGYRKALEEGFSGTIYDYVTANHLDQKEVLERYEISPNLYGASALGEAGHIHNEVSAWVFDTLYANGWLEKLDVAQFYDDEREVFLNGRQVVGKCPFEGCQSEKGYADECDLGHQYMPSELIDPVSTLSGKKPSLRNVSNWYFPLEEWMGLLQERVAYLVANTNTRKTQIETINEFLKKPCIYVQRKFIEESAGLAEGFPSCETVDDPKKSSVNYIFDSLALRDQALQVLNNAGVRFRTGKTLVPFRLSGNIDWGVPVPAREGMDSLTFWVWPESLWAPISFTIACLRQQGKDAEEARLWWSDPEAKVYQFIGQDNIYFYSVAEMALFVALGCKKGEKPDMSRVILPHIISNHHLQYMDKKASSSSELKPPMADELLEHYTPEQLRMHFFSLGLASKSSSFKPNVYMPDESRLSADNVLTQGNLLTNVYNRIIRSCLFTLQTRFSGSLPLRSLSQEMREASEKAVLDYERCMYNHEFHQVFNVLDSYIRNVNKYWAKYMKQAESGQDEDLAAQVLYDAMCCLRTIATLVHPLAPSSCEAIREFFGFSESVWDWVNIFEPVEFFLGENHVFRQIEAHTDFFRKLDYQYE